ncbi:Lipid-A-disaccharide synthase [Thalassocella blandensis]|nr:Lipid-A-disaccharide synthase [Thalassocella blandensis]
MAENIASNAIQLRRVAIVAGEESGDILGAGLIEALQAQFPDCIFEGIGGPRMLARGFVSHYPLERLAVMGLVEPLKRLPELLRIRRELRERYSQYPPDIFIGIDAPDFNLALEDALHQEGVTTAHYVSPSVWAWRQSRVKRIARAVDLMLTLFPFEAKFYTEHNVNVAFVGHPLADKFPLDDEKYLARDRLGLDPDAQYVAILPGSRAAEVEKLGKDFIQAAQLCWQQNPQLKFLLPAVNETRYQQLQLMLQHVKELPITLSLQNSHDVMAASDVVLMASGTTTLEALLLKKPMVIAYRLATLTYWILKRMVKSKFIGLPNLLADKALVPELIQHQATPEAMSQHVLAFLQDESKVDALKQEYIDIHQALKKNASEEAAKAILQCIAGKGFASKDSADKPIAGNS